MRIIVLVDDSKMLLDSYKRLIEHFTKISCVTFSNPEDALRYVLNEKDIYAVISDYEMPQMNGFELAKQIIEKLPEMRLIIMSGHDATYLRELASKNGIKEGNVSFLCKSNITELPDLLKTN